MLVPPKISRRCSTRPGSGSLPKIPCGHRALATVALMTSGPTLASRLSSDGTSNSRFSCDDLRAIDSSQFSDTDALNYDLFRRRLENSIDAHQFKAYLMPMSQRGGVQSLESTAETVRLSNVQDYEDWLSRMTQIENVIEQTTALMEEGRKTGYMPPKILMERIPNQIASQLVEDPEMSPFYKAFGNMPDIDRHEKTRREFGNSRKKSSMNPSFRRTASSVSYFNDTYLPASRDSIGASSLPNGEAFYEYRTRFHTTTNDAG